MRWLPLALIFCAGGALAQSFPNKNVLTSQVVCGSSATQIDAIRNRHAITVKVPISGATVYIGPANVTTNTGLGIDAQAAMTLEPFSGALYCVTGGSQSVQVLQTLP